MRATFYGALAAAIAAIFAPSAEATLTFYYDPLTGNVSMDTTHTRSGSVYVYALSLGSMSFRSENLIRITNSTFLTQNSHALGEGSFSDPWSGLYTIGDVLPTGLTESEWSSLFTYNSGVARYRNEYLYTDVIGGGAPPPATFVYGRPEGEFQNASDLLDPDTLNWAETATLRYFPDTGNVTLQTAGRDGGYITAFMLESAGKFTPAAYDPAFRANVFSEVSDSRIAGIFSLLRPGSYRLGEILPAGM
ncbi:MAG TPA: hypothetical protein PJ982_14235, partial [Lacipirellulaceae bacterium]|nr:hypothetical protein [Lacipirellulaceae bacterium]